MALYITLATSLWRTGKYRLAEMATRRQEMEYIFCVVMAIATFLIVRWVITLFPLSDKCSSSYFLLLYSTYEGFGMGYRGWTFQPAMC